MEKTTKQVDNTSMAQLVEEMGPSLIPFRGGDVIEVKILDISRNKILVDVAGLTMGVIPQREFSTLVPEMKEGDKVLAYVLSMENNEGNVVLSLRRADRERVFRTLEEKFKEGQPVSVYVTKITRGGLVVDYGGLEGFTPVSQLAYSHFPRGAHSEGEIISRLSGLLNQTLQVKILSYNKRSNKLIFSEKEATLQTQSEKVQQLKINTVIKGIISGIADFGLFINLGEFEGLVHISEIAWEKVSNLRNMFKVGQEIEVMIIGVEKGRVFLSIKRLLPDPWAKKMAKYKIGDKVSGEVTKLTSFGVFVKIDESLDALCPLEKMGNGIKKPSEIFQLDEQYDFQIESVDLSSHKITLSQAKVKTKIKKKVKKTK